MKVTALLKQPNDKFMSNTVLGWKTHPDGTTVYWRPEPHAWALLVAIFLAALGFFWLYQDYPELSSLSSPIPAIACLLVGLGGIGQYMHLHRVVRKLKSIPSVAD